MLCWITSKTLGSDSKSWHHPIILLNFLAIAKTLTSLSGFSLFPLCGSSLILSLPIILSSYDTDPPSLCWPLPFDLCLLSLHFSCWVKTRERDVVRSVRLVSDVDASLAWVTHCGWLAHDVTSASLVVVMFSCCFLWGFKLCLSMIKIKS